jgi:hypothetical protein
VHHTVKTWRSGSIALRLLNLGTRWRWVSGFTPRLLNFRGEVRGTHRVGCVSPRVGVDTVGKRKLLLPVSGNESKKLITVLTKLSRLHSWFLLLFLFSRTRNSKLFMTSYIRMTTARWTVWRRFHALWSQCAWSVYGSGSEPWSFELRSSTAYHSPALYGLSVLRISGKAVVAHFRILDGHYLGKLGKGPQTWPSHACLQHDN